MAPDGSGATQVTRHTQGGVKYPAISNDGSTIVYTNDHELFIMDVPSGTPQPISVELAFDPSINQVEWVDVEDQAQGFSPHPDGEMVAVDSRGEVFLVPVEDGVGEKQQITESAWRDRYQQYSPDGSQLAYVSDEANRDDIYVRRFMDREGGRRLVSLNGGDEPAWSLDGRKLFYRDGTNFNFHAHAFSQLQQFQ